MKFGIYVPAPAVDLVDLKIRKFSLKWLKINFVTFFCHMQLKVLKIAKIRTIDMCSEEL